MPLAPPAVPVPSACCCRRSRLYARCQRPSLALHNPCWSDQAWRAAAPFRSPKATHNARTLARIFASEYQKRKRPARAGDGCLRGENLEQTCRGPSCSSTAHWSRLLYSSRSRVCDTPDKGGSALSADKETCFLFCSACLPPILASRTPISLLSSLEKAPEWRNRLGKQ